MQRENKYAAIVGDFNINLLQINEREKFFDLMCTNIFFLRLLFLPTAQRNLVLSLIKCSASHRIQITQTFPHQHIMSKISDHFPCLVKLEILNDKPKIPKYIQKRVISEAATLNFIEELRSSDISSHLNANLMTDPNPEYDTFDRIALSAYEKKISNKRVKVNKHKHKPSPWITTGLIKSIEFRDKLYKRLKSCPQDSPEQNRMEYNLKTNNGYLNQCIRTAKREYYVHEFTKYKNDIRKTWDTLKDIMNTKKSKLDPPPPPPLILPTLVLKYLARKLLQTNLMNILQKLTQNLRGQLIHLIRFLSIITWNRHVSYLSSFNAQHQIVLKKLWAI